MHFTGAFLDSNQNQVCLSAPHVVTGFRWQTYTWMLIADITQNRFWGALLPVFKDIQSFFKKIFKEYYKYQWEGVPIYGAVVRVWDREVADLKKSVMVTYKCEKNQTCIDIIWIRPHFPNLILITLYDSAWYLDIDQHNDTK